MSQISADVPEKTVKTPLTLQEIGELLIKHYKLHEGLYDISIEFRFGFGAMPGDGGNRIPGAILGVNRIGLVASEKEDAATLNAATINPKRPKRKKTED